MFIQQLWLWQESEILYQTDLLISKQNNDCCHWAEITEQSNECAHWARTGHGPKLAAPCLGNLWRSTDLKAAFSNNRSKIFCILFEKSALFISFWQQLNWGSGDHAHTFILIVKNWIIQITYNTFLFWVYTPSHSMIRFFHFQI